MASPTIYFVTGTTRGIGYGLVSSLLLRPNSIIIASVRDTASKAALALSSLPKAESTKLILVKIESSNDTDAAAAIEEIQSKHGITHIDSVIANAGIGSPEALAGVKTITPKYLREYFDINTVAIIILFQAVVPLLEKSANPKFMVTTSLAGSITVAANLPIPLVAYGISKAAVNYFLSKAHQEHPNIIFVPVHPGMVATEMATGLQEVTGDRSPMISVEESVNGYLDVHDKSTRAETSAKFLQWDGEVLPW